MNRDKKNKNVNSPRHGEVKQPSGCHGVLRWAQIVFFPYTTDMTRHTSPKRFLQQKHDKTFLQKSPESVTKQKWEQLVLCPEVAERHEHAICPQSAFFMKNTETNIKETHKYAKRKKRESSEKRAVLKESHKYATQKNEKNMKVLKMALSQAQIHSRRPRATSAAGICIQNQGPSRQLFW